MLNFRFLGCIFCLVTFIGIPPENKNTISDKGNLEAPGKYHATGDPSISAGPDNVFWYANVVLSDPYMATVAVLR